MPLTQDILRRLVNNDPTALQDLLASYGKGVQATAPTMPTGGNFMPEVLTRPPASPDLSRLPTTGGNFMPEVLTRPPEPAAATTLGNIAGGGAVGGLWDRVKDFFGPDEDATPEDEAIEDEISSAGWAGAGLAAAQAAQDYRSTPFQVLTNALAGYASAKTRARTDLRKEAKEDRILGLRERQLTAEINKTEREDMRKEAQLKQAQEAVEGLPEGPQKENARRLLAIGETDALAKMLSPDQQNLMSVGEGGIFDPNIRQWVIEPKVKPTTPFGSDALGYFQVGPDNQIQQVVKGIGRAPTSQTGRFKETKQGLLDTVSGTLTPYPAGYVPDLEGEAGSIQDLYSLARSLPPGDPRRTAAEAVIKRKETGEIASSQEDRQRLLSIAGRVVDEGGWQGISPADAREYYILRKQAERGSFNPQTGQYEQSIDLSLLPEVPEFLLKGEPPLGVPGAGGPPPDVPVLTPGAPPGAAGASGQPIPPASALAPAPAPTSAPAPDPFAVTFPEPKTGQRATKEQIEDFNKARSGQAILLNATDRLRELLNQAQGLDVLAGPIADRIRINIASVVTALGQQSDAGTMQESDLKRFNSLVGDPTQVDQFLASQIGLKSLRSTIDEMDLTAQKGMFSKAVLAGQNSVRARIGSDPKVGGQDIPIFRTEQEADRKVKSLPKGSYFIDPDGQLRGPT